MMVVALEIDDIPCTTFFCLGKLTEVNCRKSVSARLTWMLSTVQNQQIRFAALT